MSLTAVRQEYYSLTDADGIGYTSQPGSPSFIRPHDPPCFASGFLFGTFCTVCGSDTVEVRVTCTASGHVGTYSGRVNVHS